MLSLQLKTRILNDRQELLHVLEIIYAAMQQAEHIVQEAADDHRIMFSQQLQQLGIEKILGNEPYLSELLTRFQLQFEIGRAHV